MNRIEASGNHLKIDSVHVEFLHPIQEAFLLKSIVIVFLDPDSNLGRDGQYKNLLAFNMKGEKLWEAELPTSKTSDVYWRIKRKSPLVVSSFSSYECIIDENTGKIVSSEFYK
jgi:hypothetical protein